MCFLWSGSLSQSLKKRAVLALSSENTVSEQDIEAIPSSSQWNYELNTNIYQNYSRVTTIVKILL